ncbi:hypothetical protein MASR1M74_16440 [Lentimicrobium sp.]
MKLIILILSIILIVLINKLYKLYKSKVNALGELHEYKILNYDLNKEKNKLEYELRTKKTRIENLENCIKEKDSLYEKISDISEVNVSHISMLYADFLTLEYNISEKFFSRSNSYVNKDKVLKITELKKRTKEHIEKYRLLEYKYEYLLSIFPELEIFTDSIASLKEFNKEFNENINELQIDFDRTRYYLSKEEYLKLSEEERNQLALDRYINGRKTNWQIGRDYEMFIGYEYEKEGFEVNYYGIEYNLNDLGRDLIVSNNDVIKIIQCKYWSQDKVIREKHITQLYGTTVQFIISNNQTRKKVIPVLVTNTKLSDKAKEFANFLNVEYVEHKKLGDYPRIKCNTNRDEFGFETYIYHLPFDQQYDRTKISRKGDFYAFCVKEAMSKGFRRAKRFYG